MPLRVIWLALLIGAPQGATVAAMSRARKTSRDINRHKASGYGEPNRDQE